MPVFFFFQAEDGIRDYKVTGVQTCALPISGSSPSTAAAAARPGAGSRACRPRRLRRADSRRRRRIRRRERRGRGRAQESESYVSYGRILLPGRLDRHPELQQRWPIAGEGAADRVRQRVDSRQALPPRAERARQRGEVGIAQIGLAPAPLVHPLLEILDRAVALVVDHEEHDRQAVLHRRRQLGHREHEAAVARDRDDRALGARELGPDRRRHPVAAGPGPSAWTRRARPSRASPTTATSALNARPMTAGSRSRWISVCPAPRVTPSFSSERWPSLVPTASTTSALPSAPAVARRSGSTLCQSGSRSSSAPRPPTVLTTGAPSRRASAASSRSAPAATTPPPVMTRGRVATRSLRAAVSTSAT